ncbi:hypothetical protein GN958_ATG09597 [Phytophthora infestans]|uniref:Uncharacterized protein n=1 Tax=Phytophthora infestans TaxID=4787 RepID=A0A8S9UP88_PHYIN|nr:hypothetical protein GN958_ATG09597 [Phytophthora infestans]
MSAQFINALVQLIDRIDDSPRKYDLKKIKPRISYSKDRYVQGVFMGARDGIGGTSTGVRWIV